MLHDLMSYNVREKQKTKKYRDELKEKNVLPKETVVDGKIRSFKFRDATTGTTLGGVEAELCDMDASEKEEKTDEKNELFFTSGEDP